jgi:hypothetical protein
VNLKYIIQLEKCILWACLVRNGMECAWHCTFHLNFPLLFCLAVWRPWKINSRLALDTGNIQSKMRLHNPKELLSTFPAEPYPTARSLCQFLLPLATKKHEKTHILHNQWTKKINQTNVMWLRTKGFLYDFYCKFCQK